MKLRVIPIKNCGKERKTVSLRIDRNPANLVGKCPDKRDPNCTENYPDVIVHLEVDKNRIDMSQNPWLADVTVSCSYRKCKYHTGHVVNSTLSFVHDTATPSPPKHR
jgi:hypothetical protein